jgi:Acetyltransferase (GNAT) domain
MAGARSEHMTRDRYAVRLYEPELAEACDRFTGRVWATDGHQDGSDRLTGTTSPRVLFLKGDEVIGHVATTPARLAVRGRLHDASWAVGLVVLPEHRNGPVAALLVKKLNDAVEIGLTLHVEPAALRVFTGVGWRYLGVVPQYIRVLNTRAFVRTFARQAHEFLPGRWSRCWRALTRVSAPVAALGRIFFAGLSMAGAARRLGHVRLTVVEERGFDPSYTELAERVKDKFAAWIFRDESYLRARYGSRMVAYRLLACRTQGRLLGYCVVKLKQFEGDPRMGDIRMGTLVDCVFDPGEPGALDSLLGAAVVLCRREKIDVLFCSASLRELRRRLRWHGFVQIPGTLNAAFHDRMRVLGEDLPLEAWHLMRGDSDADANC